MALASELSIRSQIVTAIKAALPNAKVYPRVRRPQLGTPAEHQRIYVDVNGNVNVWFVRRIQRQPEVDVYNVVQKVVQIYKLIAYRSVVDNDDDAIASEAIFQADIESVAAAFESGINFNLNGVTA